MNAKETLKQFIPRVNRVIKSEMDSMFSDAENVSEFIRKMANSTYPLLMNGKRLRGAFVYYSYLMHGGKDKEEILKASAFVEMIHSYILIMDDVIDKDDKRRGNETVHSIFRKVHEDRYSKREPIHFGNSIAICAGMIVNHFAQNILLRTNFDKAKILDALVSFNQAIAYTGYGEILDVVAESKDDVTQKEALDIMHYKTAMYTYENPLHFGAILAGANQQDLDSLSEYAIPGGIAFQIQDDIIGMFGDEEKTGKPADSDIKEGKMNLLTLDTFELAEKSDADRFEELLGKEDITADELEEAREIIIRSGALEKSKEKAQELVKESLDVVEKNDRWQGEGREFLAGIAKYMIERDL